MKFLKLLFLILTWSIPLLCQKQTYIQINDSTYSNIPLRIYAYEDLLTHSLERVGAAKVDAKGKALIALNIKEAQLLYIPIYSFRLAFYATPHTTIRLQLPNLQKLKTSFERLKNYSGREFQIFVEPRLSLNEQIYNYDKAYNKFVNENFEKIYQKKNATQYKHALEDLRKLHDSNYFKDYVFYKEAYLDYVAGSREKMLPSYFAHRPILLQNTAYVSLLRKLALPFAIDFAHTPKFQKLYTSFSANKSHNGLIKISQELTQTEDKSFNEHFLLYVLHLGIQQKTLPKQLALSQLKHIIKHSPNYHNKQIAKHIAKKATGSFFGTTAPPFSMKDANGVNYDNKLFNAEKPTLLAFFDGNTDNSKSISTLYDLQKKYKEAFEVVVMNAEISSIQLPKGWKEFVIPYHSYILQDYHLGRFPYYLLINEKGEIAKETWQQYFIRLGN